MRIRKKQKRKGPPRHLDGFLEIERREYAYENGFCEVYPTFGQLATPLDAAGKECSGVAWNCAADVHHIFGGRGCRYNFLSNMISVCRPFHAWAHRNNYHGKVLCLYVKLQKREINWPELDACSGKDTRGWLEILPLYGPWADMRKALLDAPVPA